MIKMLQPKLPRARLLLVLILALFFTNQFSYGGGIIVPSDSSQADFTKTYKMVFYEAIVNYRFSNSTQDENLFPAYGEHTPYWIMDGANGGSFVLPDKIHPSFKSVTHSDYGSYNWQNKDHYAIQFKNSSWRVAILRSNIKHNNKTVNWEAIYFKNMFDTYLYNSYHFVDEEGIDTAGISGATQLLIIPSFTANGDNQKYYIDSIFNKSPNMADKIKSFLAGGGTIYAEGNAAYFLEKLGILDSGTVNFDYTFDPDPNTNLLEIEFTNSDNPVAFTKQATGNYIYSNPVPQINGFNGDVIARTPMAQNPVVFALSGDDANNGRVLCNTGLPTIGGTNNIGTGSRQLQWTMNSILYAFAKKIDVTRSLWNELPDSLTCGKNAISYDRVDTFEVRVQLRNLSSETITGIQIEERIKDYFTFVDVPSGEDYETNGNRLYFKNITMAPRSEKTIVYRLQTPEPESKMHEQVSKYISWRNYIYVSFNITSWSDSEGKSYFYQYRNYADVMFSAFLVADTDLNWKNFLGMYFQPFKVFMIMENKERTDARETIYTQYIPKDVPFYWSDNSINIPILKTPGGKYVDVLKGSNDLNNPQYDMDSDGDPDAWLDTASIYPKGYKIEETSVYWLNPWEHLRTGDTTYYEDIDHDGVRAQDLDGDGVVDVEEPGDKIRVWKVTWDIGTVRGYDYFDPYCYYEIWVDPPDLVKMSAGVGKAHDLCDDVNGMYYPYTPDINNADLSDTSWTHWMERDDDGDVIWKQLIYQKINNYEGFTYIDTAETGYRLKPTDYCAGTVPQPHREYIAVLSLGGEEIDMTNYTPKKSLYSNIEYKTIFNEHRTTPIRSTYTYYAPLPNPLQFEYLSNNYTVTEPGSGDTLRYLPAQGTANLTFDVDASTEYTYYWIRNAGHDVDYNDPSERIEGVEELGDGVFGYMVYEIPKGLGGYKIHFPKDDKGNFLIEEIVEVDGKPFEKWLDNPNTKNEIEIWEDPFTYKIYIPQLLIPPALDDDNFDGIDDWIDDRGDRFCSSTGFLHDGFMLDDGEDWLDYPEEPFIDDIYGQVDSGWYHGADETYGDDFFENLGKTHFKFHAIYEGMGKEGPVDISKGGWLVVEEIFGGSPWVIFSHVLSGFAKGVDYNVNTQPNPSMIKFGMDTTFVKHTITDRGEPHDFDHNFDPYHVSYGFGESTVTTYVGGRDPCSLMEPAINMSAIIDPAHDNTKLTLVPMADSSDNPDLTDYPKEVEGSFIEVKIEVSNGTDDNWLNTKIEPDLPDELGNSEVVMSYVAYPRPLVPAKVDPKTGEIIQGGDDLGTFTQGWRFNQPESEVLVKMGNILPLLQPSRRAYYMFLVKVDETLDKGIYRINFDMSGTRRHYDGSNEQKVDYEIPPAMFSMSLKDAFGNVKEYQQLVIGQGSLKDLQVQTTDWFTGLSQVKWSDEDISHLDWDSLNATLATNYDANSGIETINLSQFAVFPTVEQPTINILERGEVYSYYAEDQVELTEEQQMSYDYDREANWIFQPRGAHTVQSNGVSVTPVGPRIKTYKEVVEVNGNPPDEEGLFTWDVSEEIDIKTMIEISNSGNDIDEQALLEINPGPYFVPIEDKLPDFCTVDGNVIEARPMPMIPGEKRKFYVHFGAAPDACDYMYDLTMLIPQVDITYYGRATHDPDEKSLYHYPDKTVLDFPAFDFNLIDVEIDRQDVTYGSGAKITAKFENGVIYADDILIDFYVIVDHKDTTLVDSKTVAELNEFENSTIDMYFAVPKDAEYLEVMAKIDADGKYCEFCENNNAKSMTIPIHGPHWIRDVRTGPNPVLDGTTFMYSLPRAMRDIEIIIYSTDGVEIDVISGCPTGYGSHEVEWNYPAISKGAYIYNIIGTNEQGEKEKYFGKFIK